MTSSVPIVSAISGQTSLGQSLLSSWISKWNLIHSQAERLGAKSRAWRGFLATGSFRRQKKLREFAKRNRENSERYYIRFNQLQLRDVTYRSDATTGWVVELESENNGPSNWPEPQRRRKPNLSAKHSPKRDVSILLANFRSLLINSAMACVCSAESILGTETWLTESIEKKVTLSNSSVSTENINLHLEEEALSQQ